MRIAIDAHAIGQRLTGNEVYVRTLLKEFAELDSESEFITYVSKTNVNGWVPRGFRRRGVSGNPFLRLGSQLPTRLREDRPDLVHVQYTAPLFCPVPIVVTIHDVSYIERPEYLPTLRTAQLQISTRHTVRRAAKIITISEFSRQGISKAFDIDPENIVVTPLASQDVFHPMNRARAVQDVADSLGIHRPYILNVGDLHPRKNQIGLVRAFKELINAHPELPHALVLAGKHTWFASRVIEEIRRSGLEDRIVLTGFVDDELLPSLYNAADIFVFPSFYEGFGLPAIEAMACGRAVACSSATALPEVVDGAAILFDPESIEEQTRAIRDILIDPELAARMEKKSLQRAATFDWRETARKTLDVYYSVAERPAVPECTQELAAR